MKKPTKKAREQTVREIIDRNILDVPFSTEDTAHLADACQHDIAGAVRRVNPQFPSDTRHLHMLEDGVWAAKSWRKLIYPINKEQQAKRVMRHCIIHDLMDYMDAADDKRCANCESLDDLTVDHVAPPFDDIANEFILFYGIPETVDPPVGQVVNVFADINMEASWIAYHAANACYQILCRSCNASKGKTKAVRIR